MTTKGPSSDTLQLRRGTATEWTTADPVLSAGEVGWERNTNKVKIGDGATAWTSLPYLAGTGVGVDHGVLSGLGDDDHPQYAALAQNETIAGTWDFPATGITIGTDKNLYRSAANSLFTDNNFSTAGQLIVVAGHPTDQIRLTSGGARILFGTAEDTNLYRSAADTLKTDDGFDVLGPLRGITIRAYGPGSQMAVFDNDFATDEAFLVGVSGDDFDRFGILAGGTIQWGSGALARDTNLYRSAANQLKTDDSFLIAGSLFADNWQSYSGQSPTIRSFGDIIQLIVKANATQTANLQEWQDSSGNQLSRITALGYFSTQGNLYLQADGTSMFFGASSDTNLYRSAANVLQTDDAFVVGGGYIDNAGYYQKIGALASTRAFVYYVTGDSNFRLETTADGTMLWGSGAAPGDTNLYRSAANTLKTDDNFESLSLTMAGDLKTTADVYARFGVAGDTRMGALGPGSEAGFLIGGDVNLYRSVANFLKTDDSLYVTGQLQLEGGIDPTLWISSANSFRIHNTGVVVWGNDTNLYRKGANILATDDRFDASTVITLAPKDTTSALQNYDGVDTEPSFRWQGDGKILLGAGGSTAPDVNLYRSAANTLKTDDSFIAAESVTGLGTAGQVGIVAQTTGPSGSALQIQGAAGSRLWAFIPAGTGTGLESGAGGLSVYDGSAGSERLAFNTSGSVNIVADAGQLLFGGSQDTNLYRGSAGILTTDSKFHVIANEFAIDGVNPYIQAANAASNSLALISGTKFMWVDSTKDGLLFGSAQDTNLYRLAADYLKTDDNFLAGVDIYARHGDTGQVYIGGSIPTLIFGTALDTNLYRSAANTLKTDDSFYAMGSVHGQFFETDTGLAILSEANAGGYLELDEATGHAGAAASKGRLYFIDNGSGKLQAAIRFPTGTSQIIAMEP